MRACFLGQNVCALGYGVAMVQTSSLADPAPAKPIKGETEDGSVHSPEEFPLENLMIRDLKRLPWSIV